MIRLCSPQFRVTMTVLDVLDVPFVSVSGQNCDKGEGESKFLIFKWSSYMYDP